MHVKGINTKGIFSSHQNLNWIPHKSPCKGHWQKIQLYTSTLQLDWKSIYHDTSTRLPTDSCERSDFFYGLLPYDNLCCWSREEKDFRVHLPWLIENAPLLFMDKINEFGYQSINLHWYGHFRKRTCKYDWLHNSALHCTLTLTLCGK